jgi:hypothetical protein
MLDLFYLEGSLDTEKLVPKYVGFRGMKSCKYIVLGKPYGEPR